MQIVGKATSLKAATSNVGVIVNNKLARMWVQAGVFHFNVVSSFHEGDCRKDIKSSCYKNITCHSVHCPKFTCQTRFRSWLYFLCQVQLEVYSLFRFVPLIQPIRSPLSGASNQKKTVFVQLMAESEVAPEINGISRRQWIASIVVFRRRIT